MIVSSAWWMQSAIMEAAVIDQRKRDHRESCRGLAMECAENLAAFEQRYQCCRRQLHAVACYKLVLRSHQDPWSLQCFRPMLFHEGSAAGTSMLNGMSTCPIR